MREIPLSRGKVAIVDDADYGALSQFKWNAYPDGNAWYAHRSLPRTGLGRNTIAMHRAIIDAPAGVHVDHINGDGLDNRRQNLRVCSRTENVRNQKKQGRETSSRFKGVHWHKTKRKWLASIRVNRTRLHLGYFQTEEDAARAYNAAAVERFGSFARLNEVTHA